MLRIEKLQIPNFSNMNDRIDNTNQKNSSCLKEGKIFNENFDFLNASDKVDNII